MSKFYYFFTTLVCAVSLMAGCQKNESDAVMSDKKVRLGITVPVAETKVVAGVDETAIKNYQVFLFNDKDVLEAYVSQTASDISMDCTLGDKTVVVLANAPAVNDATTLASLLSKTSTLSDNSVDAFVMEGQVEVSIETTEDVNIVVPVVRQVAKIELVDVTTNFELPEYEAMAFSISSVYLINVPADKKYFGADAPEVWFNKSAYDPEDDNALIYDDMNDVAVTAGAQYSTRNALYCYPNPTLEDTFDTPWTARHTRLVVETVLGNETYYYPVTMPVIQQNKKYEVSLTITRPGAYSPDLVVDKFAADFAVTVKDWEVGASVSEEI